MSRLSVKRERWQFERFLIAVSGDNFFISFTKIRNGRLAGIGTPFFKEEYSFSLSV